MCVYSIFLSLLLKKFFIKTKNRILLPHQTLFTHQHTLFSRTYVSYACLSAASINLNNFLVRYKKKKKRINKKLDKIVIQKITKINIKKFFFTKTKLRLNLLSSKLFNTLYLNYDFFKQRYLKYFFFTKAKDYSILPYQTYLNYFFFTFLDKNLFISLINSSHLIPKHVYLTITDILHKITPRTFRILYLSNVSEIIISTFITKNLNFLILWFKNFVENNPLTMFQAIVRYVYRLFRVFIKKYATVYSIRGFFIRFSGKFIKGGGKKKKIIHYYNKYASTTKALKIVYKKLYLRTISGIIGCTIKLAY